MPFGAALADGGVARFRLWAPAIGEVSLLLGEKRERRDVAMKPLAGGWHEAVVYEMHVGTVTPAGTYAAAQARLADLARLGVTAIELMPLADFAGRRNWGYDGVLPFAPDAAYGTPEELKRFVEAAHGHGLMVLLDVVYNHFGPEGNHLSRYAPQFFTDRHHTPWGSGINFDDDASDIVRRFFIHNAFYWLEEARVGVVGDRVHVLGIETRRGIGDEQIAAVERIGVARAHACGLVETDEEAVLAALHRQVVAVEVQTRVLRAGRPDREAHAPLRELGAERHRMPALHGYSRIKSASERPPIT